MSTTFEKMDRMYRLQRYFYDVTRKYYLLGRDRLLNEIKIDAGDTVLEVGCGTARNLIILAQRFPEAHFFGIDASAAMLQTANKKIRSARISNITLQVGLAEDFEFERTFALNRPFDKIFFSYSISMIPSWRNALLNALKNLDDAHGSLFVLDFSDQANLPQFFRKVLARWLTLFGVRFWPDLESFMQTVASEKNYALEFYRIYRGYSFVGILRKCVDAASRNNHLFNTLDHPF